MVLTFRAGDDGGPARVAEYVRGGAKHVERTVDGQVEPRTLLDGDLQGLPTDWSPDGDYVMFQTSQIGENSDLLLVPTRGSDEPTNYLATDFNEVEAKFSPDG